jgi:hypothetical protein
MRKNTFIKKINLMWLFVTSFMHEIKKLLYKGSWSYSLVYAFGFFVLWICNFSAENKAVNFPEKWTAEHGFRAPFANIWLPLSLSIILWVLFSIIPPILERIGRVNTSMTAFITILVLFISGVILVSIFHFGPNIYWIIPGVFYAGVFAVSEAVHNYKIDYGFLSQDDLNDNIKLAILDKIYDRWFRFFGYFSAIGVAAFLSLVVNIFFSGDANLRPIYVFPMAISSAYMLIVIFCLCMWPALCHTRNAEKKLYSLTKEKSENE